MIELNEEQEVVKNKIINWYRLEEKQVFFLTGYAGTGKTTLISYIINHELKLKPNEVKFCTPTGKAASVLVSKGSFATTIHRLIYVPKKKENNNNNKFNIQDINIDMEDVEFKLKPKSEMNFKLIIIDEFSMVNEKIFEDLCSFGIKILAVGDIGQLPPVSSAPLKYLLNPDASLNNIVRQNKDNQILKIAEMARNGMYLKPGNYGDDVLICNRKNLSKELIEKIFKNCDQIIAGRNSTCKEINNYMRKLNNFNSIYPCKGDKLICLQNNYDIDLYSEDKKFEIPLMNGLIGTCENFILRDYPYNKFALVNFKSNLTNNSSGSLLVDPYIFLGEKSEYKDYQRVLIEEDGEKIKPLKNNAFLFYSELLNKFDYGYCITCHKSQGSEWDKVVIIDESYIFGNLSNKWLYTAITRAKKKCIIIK